VALRVSSLAIYGSLLILVLGLLRSGLGFALAAAIRVEEKMSNNNNYGGGQGRSWQGGNNYGRDPGFNNFRPPYNPNWRNRNWRPQNGGNKENYQQKAMSNPTQKAASSASGGSGASATVAGPSTATSP
jgi:hypothetical protein